MQNALAKTKPTPIVYPWKARQGETPEELLEFLYWACCDGPINEALAHSYQWTERANALSAFDDLQGLTYPEKAAAIMFSLLDQGYIAARQQHVEALENPERTAREWSKEALVSLFVKAASHDMPKTSAGPDWSQAPSDVLQAHLKVSNWLRGQMV